MKTNDDITQPQTADESLIKAHEVFDTFMSSFDGMTSVTSAVTDLLVGLRDRVADPAGMMGMPIEVIDEKTHNFEIMDFFDDRVGRPGNEQLIEGPYDRILSPENYVPEMHELSSLIALLCERIARADLTVAKSGPEPAKMPTEPPADFQEKLIFLVAKFLTTDDGQENPAQGNPYKSRPYLFLAGVAEAAQEAVASSCALDYIVLRDSKRAVVTWPIITDESGYYGREEARAAARALPAMCDEIKRMAPQIESLIQRMDAPAAQDALVAEAGQERDEEMAPGM